MRVLFVSHSKSDVTQLWYASGCHIMHTFEHLVVTTIDDLLGKIREIQPDLVVVSYNVGSHLHSGVDVAFVMQDDFADIPLAENTCTIEESFQHRDVRIDFNVRGDPERLAQWVGEMAA
jgi:hypothetical protein